LCKAQTSSNWLSLSKLIKERSLSSASAAEDAQAWLAEPRRRHHPPGRPRGRPTVESSNRADGILVSEGRRTRGDPQTHILAAFRLFTCQRASRSTSISPLSRRPLIFSQATAATFVTVVAFPQLGRESYRRFRRCQPSSEVFLRGSCSRREKRYVSSAPPVRSRLVGSRDGDA
jgi:hypothetical protein